jgi:hypothetical protein
MLLLYMLPKFTPLTYYHRKKTLNDDSEAAVITYVQKGMSVH